MLKGIIFEVGMSKKDMPQEILMTIFPPRGRDGKIRDGPVEKRWLQSAGLFLFDDSDGANLVNFLMFFRGRSV